MLELARRLERAEDVVLATAVRTEGAPPCRPGFKLLLGRQGPIAGTLGCAELDAQAAAEVESALASRRASLRSYIHDLGRVETWLEPFRSRPLLVVLGATPVAGWLLRWAPDLGWDVALVERRAERVTPELATGVATVAPSADRLGLGREADPGRMRAIDAVHTDHDAPGVAEDLATVLAAGARFVGVMGSRRHVGRHLEALAALGVAHDEIERVHSPVGIDIGARTPSEIALSILAGLVAAGSGHTGGWLDQR